MESGLLEFCAGGEVWVGSPRALTSCRWCIFPYFILPIRSTRVYGSNVNISSSYSGNRTQGTEVFDSGRCTKLPLNEATGTTGETVFMLEGTIAANGNHSVSNEFKSHVTTGMSIEN